MRMLLSHTQPVIKYLKSSVLSVGISSKITCTIQQPRAQMNLPSNLSPTVYIAQAVANTLSLYTCAPIQLNFPAFPLEIISLLMLF